MVGILIELEAATTFIKMMNYIPIHEKKDLGKGLFYKILKQCDIDRE